MDSADDVLEDSVVHGDSASEPVTAVVGVDESILAEDSLVLDELEVRGLGQVVVLQDSGPRVANKGLVNEDINSGGGSSKLGSGGEGGLGGTVEEGGTGILGQDALVVGGGEGPGGSIVVVLGSSSERGPGDDGLVGLGVGGALEAVVVVVDSSSQVLCRSFQVEEGRVELEPLCTLSSYWKERKKKQSATNVNTNTTCGERKVWKSEGQLHAPHSSFWCSRLCSCNPLVSLFMHESM